MPALNACCDQHLLKTKLNVREVASAEDVAHVRALALKAVDYEKRITEAFAD